MFPETSWTLIAAATLHGDLEGRSALENLCARCYLPVRSFIIWNGRHACEADDHTQAFFLHLCEKAIMQRADKERGKFSTFMISVLKNFLSHQDRANATQKRGGGILVMALDEAEDPPEIEDKFGILDLVQGRWVKTMNFERTSCGVFRPDGQSCWIGIFSRL